MGTERSPGSTGEHKRQHPLQAASCVKGGEEHEFAYVSAQICKKKCCKDKPKTHKTVTREQREGIRVEGTSGGVSLLCMFCHVALILEPCKILQSHILGITSKLVYIKQSLKIRNKLS